MKLKRKIIRIDEELCNGCGNCVVTCAEGAIRVSDGKARIISEQYCDGLGACLGECPTGALTIVERVADDFDAEAVEKHLASEKETEKSPEAIPMACGCPSSQIRTFTPGPGRESPGASGRSELSHWPVQIRLVPPNAPFLKGAHLLITADCAPVAYPKLHDDFLKGRVILLGCPKFDDVQAYVEKFRDIFTSAEIRSVLVLDMEVPCCSALPKIVKKGMEEAGKDVPLEEVVISSRGEVCRRQKISSAHE